MRRILSCFTNTYGPSGVWTAAEMIRDAGIDRLELALRGHDFGGLVIPESVVITEKADDATAGRFVDHLAAHGVGVSGCNVGGADLRTEEGVALIERLASYPLPWTGDEGFKKAEVTGGGIALDEVDPRTLESRRHPGLFLCGEMLDAFGPIGGHNFAWAWATGRLAGIGAAS